MDLDDFGCGLDLMEAQRAESTQQSPRTEWMRRSALGIACSELPAVWLALGLADEEERRRAVRYVRAQRDALFAQKANPALLEPPSRHVETGRIREPRLFERWAERLRHDKERLSETERRIDHHTVFSLEAHPAVLRLLPLVDWEERRLIDSVDGVALTWDNDLVVVQAKCLRGTVGDLTGASDDELPWYWRLSMQGELAVTGASFGVVLVGEGWAGTNVDYDSLPLRGFSVPRDEHQIARIRAAVRDGWAEIERLVGQDRVRRAHD